MRRYELSGWSLVMVSLTVAGVIWFLATIADNVNRWMLANNHLSGWAQALGGILAIAGAFMIGRSQITAGRKLDTERRAIDDIRRIATVDALLMNAVALCNLFKAAWEKRDGLPVPAFGSEHWMDCKEGIAAIDPFDCPSPAVVLYLVQIPRQFDRLIQAHESFHRAFFADKGPEFGVTGHSVSLETAMRDLGNKLDETIGLLTLAHDECADASRAIAAVLEG